MPGRAATARRCRPCPDLRLEPSGFGAAEGAVNQLRDPAIYEEDGRIYLLYAIAGESGIAIAELSIDC